MLWRPHDVGKSHSATVLASLAAVHFMATGGAKNNSLLTLQIAYSNHDQL